MPEQPSNGFLNRIGGERISSGPIDELIGLCRGLAADGSINQSKVEFLQKWLAANVAISDQPVIRTLHDRINSTLADHVADEDECDDLIGTLHELASGPVELGESLKSTSLPLCKPAPFLTLAGQRYCFTGSSCSGSASSAKSGHGSRRPGRIADPEDECDGDRRPRDLFTTQPRQTNLLEELKCQHRT